MQHAAGDRYEEAEGTPSCRVKFGGRDPGEGQQDSERLDDLKKCTRLNLYEMWEEPKDRVVWRKHAS